MLCRAVNQSLRTRWVCLTSARRRKWSRCRGRSSSNPKPVPWYCHIRSTRSYPALKTTRPTIHHRRARRTRQSATWAASKHLLNSRRTLLSFLRSIIRPWVGCRHRQHTHRSTSSKQPAQLQIRWRPLLSIPKAQPKSRWRPRRSNLSSPQPFLPRRVTQLRRALAATSSFRGRARTRYQSKSAQPLRLAHSRWNSRKHRSPTTLMNWTSENNS